MNKVIIVENNDGAVSVIAPTGAVEEYDGDLARFIYTKDIAIKKGIVGSSYVIDGIEIKTNGMIAKIVTEEEMVDIILKRDVTNESSQTARHVVLNRGELPSRVLRGAWTIDGIDIGKAKKIAHDIRRDKRRSSLERNMDVMSRDALGVRLATGEDAVRAKLDNEKYMRSVDDPAQIDIDNSSNEADILSVISRLSL